MALLLPNSVCFLTPKCGSQWIIKALTRAAIPFKITGGVPSDDYTSRMHSTLSNTPLNNLFAFAFIRNPLSWYQSYWSYRMEHGWTTEGLDIACAADTFHEFVRRCLLHYPGHASVLYDNYIGVNAGELPFVGRQENLAKDLVDALNMAGESFNASLILNCEPENTRKWKSSYTFELAKAVINADARTLWRFGYMR